jgi:hypothetical protein
MERSQVGFNFFSLLDFDRGRYEKVARKNEAIPQGRTGANLESAGDALNVYGENLHRTCINWSLRNKRLSSQNGKPFILFPNLVAGPATIRIV